MDGNITSILEKLSDRYVRYKEPAKDVSTLIKQKMAGARSFRGAEVPHVPVLLVFLFVLVLVPSLFAQVLIDGVLLKLGADVVTVSDVRQARLLKLVDVPDATDQAFVDALVKRRLILQELGRNPPAEPASSALDARRRQWESALGPGVDLSSDLARAGMTEAALRAWLRDDLRITAYVDQRFPASGDRAAAIAAWVAELRQRAGIK
jgi:hypothetical protein